MTDRFYLAIDRDDGSRTYKGAWSFAHCEREQAAWIESFDYPTRIIPARDARDDVRQWTLAIRGDDRYYPSLALDQIGVPDGGVNSQ